MDPQQRFLLFDRTEAPMPENVAPLPRKPASSSVINILTLALQAVSSRMLVFLSMSMSFGLFCWAMWAGETLRLIIAGSFTVLVFLPVLFKGASHGQDGQAP